MGCDVAGKVGQVGGEVWGGSRKSLPRQDFAGFGKEFVFYSQCNRKAARRL